MRTNIDIDQTLVAEAMAITGQKTKKGAVEFALRQIVERQRRKEALDSLWGIGWYGDLDEIRGDPVIRATR